MFTRIDRVPRRCGFQGATTQGREKQLPWVHVLFSSRVIGSVFEGLGGQLLGLNATTPPSSPAPGSSGKGSIAG